ncbi:MAG: putative prolyl oligopeptidase [Actinomycetia bacterium]|nr:putative prolyl oligopeptidase [Actinomycetes bacterium]
MTDLDPPAAPRRTTILESHGHERVDEWYWLRQRDDPAVREYLEAENAYTDAVLAPTKELRDRLFDEIKNRIQETDASAPSARGEHEYFSRTREGLEYRIHCRRPAGTPGLPDPEAEAGAPEGEVVILDENTLAAGHDFFALHELLLSPDQTRIAYGADDAGDEVLELRVRDLESGVDLADEISGAVDGLAWSADGRMLYYCRPDATLRPFEVWRHELGTPADADVLVYSDPDERFFVSVGSTRTRDFIVISSDSKLTSEVHVIPADDPTAAPRVIEPRVEGIEYGIEHRRTGVHDDFYVVTNADDSPNFKLMVTPVETPARNSWREVIGHRDDVRIEGIDAFAGHLVVSERRAGLEQLRVLEFGEGAGHSEDGSGPTQHLIEMPEEVYSVGLGANPEFETDTVRFVYTSLTTPVSDFAYDPATRTRTLVKRQTVLGGYDPDDYVTHRLWATADDGVQVPISLVARKDVEAAGGQPLLLYGYGSYEASIDPAFSSLRLSLLERGVVFAIAHVRGGGELGRHWYEDGKLMHKRNTFTDFVAAAQHLIDAGYTTPELLAAEGRSAGGLLMGAVANLAPDRFRAIVAGVPFVDVVSTMLDASIPLTVTEWEEWGNPVESAEAFEYMLSYSPYDNVEAREYPAILVTAGLNDPRVQYWEPAKWVAKLRTRATNGPDRPILLRTEMGAGHGGPSGRYDAWREEALVLGFILDQLGVGSPAST